MLRNFLSLVIAYWARLLILLGGIGLAILGNVSDIQNKGLGFFKTTPGIVFGISALLFTIGTIYNWKETENSANKIAKLEADLENEVSLKPLLLNLINSYISQLSDELGFSSLERISVYIHNKNKGNFVRIGRYSKNPNFCETGRLYYRDSEGCIGRAWSNGECFIDNLPDPENDKEKYFNVLKNQWSIKKETSKRFAMKSRNYYGLAIQKDIFPMTNIAVIIFESVHNNRLDSHEIKAKLNSSKVYFIIEKLAIVLSQLNIVPDEALNEGY